MEWWEELYDDIRMREMFEKIPKGRTEAQVDFVEKICNLRKSAKILDLGCGWGRHSIELAKRGYEITGLEINPSYIKEAKKRANSTNFRFYSYHEIRAILKSTGFRKIQSYGSLEETPIELDTHLMEIIGRKL